MPVITLLTDFGIEDEYAGVLKGVILSINPSATIVDITHQVAPQDVVNAAYLIESASRYFPPGTIHTVIVDPGVGSDRAIIALKRFGHIFLAPDNGVLSFVANREEIDMLIRVENRRFFLENIGNTFHGRDIFAPVAAHLSSGCELAVLGPSMDINDVVRLEMTEPAVGAKGDIVGSVVAIDRFGNLITNIDARSIRSLTATAADGAVEILIGENRINGISDNYHSVEKGNPLAVIGSRGCVEIAVNCGDAAGRFKAGRGDRIRVIVTKS